MNLLDRYKEKSVGVYDAETGGWKHVVETIIDKGIWKNVVFDETDYGSVFDVYILPGFIDAHCHIFENPLRPDNYNIDKEELLNLSEMFQVASKNVLTACEAGITSVKDLGGRFYHSIEVAKQLNDILCASRVYTSGCYFTSKSGHCSDRGGIVIDELSDFIKALEYLENQNIRFCKLIHGDDGFETHLLVDMVTEAHKRSMIVSCHAFTEKSAGEAVEAGIDILEHAGDYSEELLNKIKESDIIIVPTFVAAYDGQSGISVLTDVDNSILQSWYIGEKKVIPKLFEKKIKVALGTDSGFDGTTFDSLIREIKLIKEIFPNISIEELLYSAFVVTPRTIGMQNQQGKIKTGYFSDFQVYYKNPVDNIEILGHPQEVWVRGEEVYRNFDNKDVIVRRLEVSDVDDIKNFISHPFFDCALNGDFWSIDELKAWLSIKYDYCVGAFLSDELIGFCMSHFHKEAHKVHLENVFVAEPYRDRGVGYRLLNVVINYYSNYGPMRYVGLVDEDNSAAYRLLLKVGFSHGSKFIWMQKNG